MDSILGAEILKTRKRWMPYVLFIVCIIGVVFQILVPGYLTYQQSDFPEDRIGGLQTFALPYSLASLLDTGQFWGSMFVGILAASVIATEYNWGTVRQVLIRGQSRGSFLLTKIAAVAIVSTFMLLAALIVGMVLSLYLTAIADEDITLDVPGGPNLPEMLLMIIRAGYCIIPYGMLAFMLAAVARSGTLGIAGIVVFLFSEAIAIEILDGVGGIGPTLADISIGENVKSLIAANRIAGIANYNPLSLRDTPPPDELADPNVAALILLTHIALYTSVTFYVFGRRDVKVG